MRKYAQILCLLLSLIVISPAYATSAENPHAAQTNVINYNSINKELDSIEKELKQTSIKPNMLSDYVTKLDNILSEVNSGKKQTQRDLEFVEKRIEALGAAPEDGSKEVAVIANKRKEFNKEASLLRAKISEADVSAARIEELETLILEIRSNALLGRILESQPPLISPQNFYTANKLFVTFVYDVIKSPVVWYKNLSSVNKDFVKNNIAFVLLFVALALIISIYLRALIVKYFGYKHVEDERIRYSRKVVAAFFVALSYGIIPASLICAALVWMYNTKVFTLGFFGLIINSLLFYSLFIVLGRALTRVTLTPYNERWRLVSMSTPKAKKLKTVFYFFITMISLCSFMEYVSSRENYPVELMYYVMTISCAVKALSIIMVTKIIMLDDDCGSTGTYETQDDDGEDSSFTPAMKLTFTVALFSIGVFVLSLFGYPRLADFIFDRFLASCFIVGLFFILRRAVSEALHRVLFLRFWAKTFKLRRRLISKIDFWMNLLVDPLFIIFAGIILLSIWGVSTDILLQSIKKVLFGFSVGGVNISLISILLAICTFFVTLAVMKALRRHLINNVLNQLEMDDGIKNSLASGMGFISFIIAAILSIIVLGGNLSNLALIAGALSVGIGLGLQNIVNNFVSGIILLFERPVKVGDWVKIAGEEGKVKQINIRATEVETFNRASVIIPNATLLSNSLTNLTHTNNWARYSVKVGVAYGSDVEKVREILLECATSNRRILKKPEPYVLFQDFGACSLDFELRFYVSDIWNGWNAPSDVRFEINRRFKDEGIEIPFPQMVVHQGSVVSEETQSQFYAAKKGKK